MRIEAIPESPWSAPGWSGAEAGLEECCDKTAIVLSLWDRSVTIGTYFLMCLKKRETEFSTFHNADYKRSELFRTVTVVTFLSFGMRFHRQHEALATLHKRGGSYSGLRNRKLSIP